MKKKVNYVLDADIHGFFDNLDKSWLIKFVEHRVADSRILRLIRKWLNAGVMEEGQWSETKTGMCIVARARLRCQTASLHLCITSLQSYGEDCKCVWILGCHGLISRQLNP
jgi:hypothetical protein